MLHQMSSLGQLVWREGRGAAAPTASRPRCTQTGHRPFTSEVALHFGESCHHMEEEAAGGRCRIDAVGEASELDSVIIQLGDELDQLPNGATQTVEFPHH